MKKFLSWLLSLTTFVRYLVIAILRIAHAYTIDEVVFAEPGDQALLAVLHLCRVYDQHSSAIHLRHLLEIIRDED